MPRVSRAVPAYAQIADDYRRRIEAGFLVPTAALPTYREIAAEWGVSVQTAQSAVSALKVAGLVVTSSQGTFVAADYPLERTPAERFRAMRPGRAGNGAERIEVTAAEIVTAPVYVAEILGLPAGTQVIRREEITHRGRRPRVLAVDWVPAFNRSLASELTERAPIEGGAIGAVERHTGRQVVTGRDAIRGRGADAREAAALAVPARRPVAAGVTAGTTKRRMLLYGEWVIRENQSVMYEYQVEP
jgi:GntR family transcriptional regulator